jgi:hypothetical protein
MGSPADVPNPTPADEGRSLHASIIQPERDPLLVVAVRAVSLQALE